MRVVVKLFGAVREAAGAKELSLDLPEGACANEALPAILAGADPRLGSVLAEKGVFRPSVMVILRDETIDPGQPDLLAEGDELSLLPPMSGG